MSHTSLVRGTKLWVLPLHGNLPPGEQKKVFQRPSDGSRKVVLSTNIAETSITIDDIGFVVDSILVKEMHYDPINKMPALVDTLTSRASTKQRAGRAGRVKSGRVFRLISRGMYGKLHEQQLPEMQRVPLEQLCLQIKLLELVGVTVFCILGDVSHLTLLPLSKLLLALPLGGVNVYVRDTGNNQRLFT